MGNSIEKPGKFEVVFGDMAYDGKTNTIECPPTTVNNRKSIPQKGRIMPEGEIAIKLGNVRYQKDEKGNIVNVQFLEGKETKKEEQEQSI